MKKVASSQDDRPAPSSPPSGDREPARRLGVFGGTFDPPHYGHLALAETARVQLELDTVLFVPAGSPPHKPDAAITSPEDRVALVRAAIADNAAFAISCVDVDRPGPHYTVDMVARLREEHPEVESWHFLMGEDSLHDLPTWHEPARLLQQVTLAVMPRMGRRADIPTLEQSFPELGERLVWLDVPPVHLSATEMRHRVRSGLPLRYLVPPAVEALIHERSLYGQ
jgi:nicotinate-nucleotide adenylyltransferase